MSKFLHKFLNELLNKVILYIIEWLNNKTCKGNNKYSGLYNKQYPMEKKNYNE